MVAEPVKCQHEVCLAEQEVILRCARTHVDDRAADRVRQLCRQGLDGGYLVEESLIQGTLPLLHHHLSSLCPDALSDRQRDRLWDHARVFARQNLLLMGEHTRLARVFGDAGLPVISFKGPVLNAIAYGHPLLRDYTDLDYLVHREDLERATDLLLSNGYLRQSPVTAAEQSACLARGIHFEFVGEDPRLKVDLHWAMSGPEFRMGRDTRPFWSKAKTVEINGRAVTTFGDEDTLLMLCIHGTRHDWQKLTHVCDISEFLRSHPDLDWDQVQDRARYIRADRVLDLALLLAGDLLDAPIPAPLQDRIQRDGPSQMLAKLARELLFRSTDVSAGTVIKKHRLRLGLREEWLSKTQYCAGLLVPQKEDHDRIPLPPFLAAALYILRPLRILGKLRNTPDLHRNR